MNVVVSTFCNPILLFITNSRDDGTDVLALSDKKLGFLI